jgi:hypothetical protein
MNTLQIISQYFYKIFFDSCTHLFLDFPNDIFPSDCMTKILYAFLIPPIDAVCLAQYIQLVCRT